MKYAVGTLVRINAVGASKIGRTYSTCSNPLDEIGVVGGPNGGLDYRVKWSWGSTNCYLHEDLDLVITQYTDKDLEEIIG